MLIEKHPFLQVLEKDKEMQNVKIQEQNVRLEDLSQEVNYILDFSAPTSLRNLAAQNLLDCEGTQPKVYQDGKARERFSSPSYDDMFAKIKHQSIKLTPKEANDIIVNRNDCIHFKSFDNMLNSINKVVVLIGKHPFLQEKYSTECEVVMNYEELFTIFDCYSRSKFIK